jgi:hypothetical protein
MIMDAAFSTGNEKGLPATAVNAPVEGSIVKAQISCRLVGCKPVPLNA